jgi:hypothetical protein
VPPTSGHDERQRPACTCSACRFGTILGASPACDAGRAKEQTRQGAEFQERRDAGPETCTPCASGKGMPVLAKATLIWGCCDASSPWP